MDYNGEKALYDNNDICPLLASRTCMADLTATTCGDGVVDVGEECDDGGTSGGDGCSAACLVESGYVCSALLVEGGEGSSVCASSCGNGAVDYEVYTHTHDRKIIHHIYIYITSTSHLHLYLLFAHMDNRCLFTGVRGVRRDFGLLRRLPQGRRGRVRRPEYLLHRRVLQHWNMRIRATDHQLRHR